MNTQIKKHGIPLLGVLSAAEFQVLFLYFQNLAEANIGDIVVPFFVFGGTGVVFYTILTVLTHDKAKSSISTMLILLVLLNYASIEQFVRIILTHLYYWHIFPITIFLLAHMVCFIYKKFPSDLTDTILRVGSAVLTGLILINGISAVPTMLARKQAENEMELHKNADYSTVESEKEMPNIYYLLFDEYSSVAFMSKYFDYDNQPFADGLDNKGFNVSYTSHNESIMTSTILTNIMNLDYVVDNTWTEFDKKNVRISGELFDVLRENGYNLSSVDHVDFYDLPSIEEQSQSGAATTAGGETLADILYSNSMVYPFLKKHVAGIQPTINAIIEFSAEAESNEFLMVHLTVAHTPFIYDENGNVNETISKDWYDLNYYKNQYIYATKVMQQLVDGILKNDPDSIIILQSDHSARASTTPELFMELFELGDMSNIFNAVYYRGEEMKIEGLSGVNTMRTILNRLLGDNYEMLVVPPDVYKYK